MSEIAYRGSKYLVDLITLDSVQVEVDDLEHVFTIYSNFLFELISYAKKLFYFFIFFLPFSYFVSAGASNEYLLASSILFTLFICYNILSALLSSLLSAQIDAIRTLLNKKLRLIVAISKYEQNLVFMHKQNIIVLEELIAYVSQMENDFNEYDENLYEDVLIQSLNDSLYNYAAYEAMEEFTDSFFVFDDSFETVLSDYLDESFDDQNE